MMFENLFTSSRDVLIKKDLCGTATSVAFNKGAAGEIDRRTFSSRIGDLVKFLSSAKGDLANVTAPPSFLAPSSVVEVGHCWAQRPNIFTAPTKEQDPQNRSLLVLQLFLIALRSQVYIAGRPGVSIKKPLNAFLGELFFASWTDAKSKAATKLVAEQVSHHPPITAMHVGSEEHGIWADGYARVEMTFSNTVNIRQIGHAVLHIDQFDEDYLIPLPDVQVRGFLSACLYPEILGTYTVPSSSGYMSEVTFSGKGIFQGAKNYFEARIYHKDDPDRSSIYEVSGVWSEGWKIKDARTGEVVENYDVDASENWPATMDFAAVEDQDPWESRRAWGDVIEGLKKGELRAASEAKQKIEEAQRRMRCEEKNQGAQWEPLLFESIAGDEHKTFHRLAKGTCWRLADEQTSGVWRLKERGIEHLQKPYHGDLRPLG